MSVYLKPENKKKLLNFITQFLKDSDGKSYTVKCLHYYCETNFHGQFIVTFSHVDKRLRELMNSNLIKRYKEGYSFKYYIEHEQVQQPLALILDEILENEKNEIERLKAKRIEFQKKIQ